MSALVEAWRASRRESKATRARTMVGGVGDGALYGIANHELGARASRVQGGWVQEVANPHNGPLSGCFSAPGWVDKIDR